MLIVGIDVGGTNTKFGLIEDGRIIRSMQLSTNAFDVVRQLVNGIKELVQGAGRDFDEVQGIGLGFPGMVVDSVILESPNIGLQNCNIEELLSAELGKPVIARNDAELATMAEHRLGAGNNCRNMVLITLGTGVGGGIIADNKLYQGNGGAGELGHIIVERDGRPCTCGRKGCAEQYISMKALDKLAKDLMPGYPNTCITPSGDGMVNASELIRAYKRNDACAKEVVDKYVSELSNYLLSICNLFRPEKIVIGGGVVYAPEIISMVAKVCKDANFGYANSPKVDIVPATLGNEAGVLGAVVLFDEYSEELKQEENMQTAESFKADVHVAPVTNNQENLVYEEKTHEYNEPSDYVANDYATEQTVAPSEESADTDLLGSILEASKEEEQTSPEVYDDPELINRVNDLLKKKD